MTAKDTFSRLDDDDYPTYTMRRAAEMIGTIPGQQSFLVTRAGGCPPRPHNVPATVFA